MLWIIIIAESCLILPLPAQSTYMMKIQCLWFIGVYHTVIYYPQKKIWKIHKKFIKIQNPWGILLLEYYVIKDFVEIIYDNDSSLMLVYFLMGKMELLYSCSLLKYFLPIDEDIWFHYNVNEFVLCCVYCLNQALWKTQIIA